eukprot:754423-Hanusia_phi.AAC.5
MAEGPVEMRFSARWVNMVQDFPAFIVCDDKGEKWRSSSCSDEPVMVQETTSSKSSTCETSRFRTPVCASDSVDTPPSIRNSVHSAREMLSLRLVGVKQVLHVRVLVSDERALIYMDTNTSE